MSGITSRRSPAESDKASRVLVLGAKGLAADLCVLWSDAVPNISDFDVAVVAAPTLEEAQALSAEEMRAYADGFRRLLESSGHLYVVAGHRETWREEGKPVVYGTRHNYEWCPVWMSITNETGTTVRDIDSRFAWYFNEIHHWELVISHPQETEPRQYGARELIRVYATRPLASNREGGALGAELHYGLHPVSQDMYRNVGSEPVFTAGPIATLGLAPPWTREQAIEGILTNVLNRSAPTAAPPWLTTELLPPTTEQDRRIDEIDAEIGRLDAERTGANARRDSLRAISGLLYESGPRLESLVADALLELGVALGEPAAQEEFTALHDGVVAAVEVKGNSKSASQDDFRALADYLTQHDLSDDFHGSRGILVVDAWRGLPPAQRPDAFPSNVQQAAQRHGRITLVATIELYRAVLRFRAGDEAAVSEFVGRLFAQAGPVSLAQT